MTYTLEELGESKNKEAEIIEQSFDVSQVRKAARESLDFLAALAMPAVYQYSYPPVLLAAWDVLIKDIDIPRQFSRLALGLPRGFSKTTLITLYILFCILFTKKKFILVMCATSKLAENILSDVIDMLEEPNIKKVFGDWKLGAEKDTQSLKKFGFCGRNITLAAAGAETSIRGFISKHDRPDVMIFDDVQTRECADSEVQSDSLERWMYGTAMKAKSPFGCSFVFLANMYPTKYSILKKLKHNAVWTKFIVGGILEDGTSLWEELHPLEQLLTEFQDDLEAGHPEIFYAEVLNDETATAHNLIDLSKLPALPYQEGDIHGGNFIIIDPATGKVNSDAVSIGYFEIHDTKPVLIEVKEDRYSPMDMIREALMLALKYQCRIIAIESNAYQYTALYWFNFICMQQGIEGIDVVEIYSGVSSKNSRILTMLKGYAAGEIFVAPEARSAVHSQIIQFNPLKRDNTDGLLDLLTYAPKVIEENEMAIIASTQISIQQMNTIQVYSVEANSPF